GMGTRAITVILNDYGEEICVLYRDSDGNPTEYGAALKEILSRTVLTEGIEPGLTGRYANGMGCLAAQLIAHFKNGIGDFYVYPAGARGVGEEYVYTVYRTDETLSLEVFGLLHRGEVGEFIPTDVKRRARY
ncbi:MAG: hypothetical protein M3362_00355, partial [Acidobacteriota bacterium]|nr:hypothetical protein [Acidobacteriota bacterium]